MTTNAADALREERCREVGMEAAKRFLEPKPVVDLRRKGGSCRAGATLGGG